MWLDRFPSCSLVVQRQLTLNQMIVWNPETEKELLEEVLNLSTLNSFFPPDFTVQFLFFFCLSFFPLPFLSATICCFFRKDFAMVAMAWCQLVTTWLAVRQGWGLFQIAGRYKYLKNRERQPCCQLSQSDRMPSWVICTEENSFQKWWILGFVLFCFLVC